MAVFGSRHHEDQIRVADLLVAPVPPDVAFMFDVLVDAGVYAVLAEAFGEFQHAVPVFGGIMTVTEKNTPGFSL